MNKQPRMINVTVMIKDGGYKTIKITPEMLGDLSYQIVTKGVEYATLLSGVIEVVGIIVKGSQVGERVIITGSTTEVPHE